MSAIPAAMQTKSLHNKNNNNKKKKEQQQNINAGAERGQVRKLAESNKVCVRSHRDILP